MPKKIKLFFMPISTFIYQFEIIAYSILIYFDKYFTLSIFVCRYLKQETQSNNKKMLVVREANSDLKFLKILFLS